jgi:addiction module HigA family antidote
MPTMYNPASPGELLREFLGDHSVTDLAEHIGVSRATVSRILNGRTAVTVDLSIRLGEALSLSPDFFSKAQLQYDMWIESQRKRKRISSFSRFFTLSHAPSLSATPAFNMLRQRKASAGKVTSAPHSVPKRGQK